MLTVYGYKEKSDVKEFGSQQKRYNNRYIIYSSDTTMFDIMEKTSAITCVEVPALLQ